MDCLFCKIVAGDLPSEIIYQDDQVVAIRDISGQAPSHFLLLPRRHISTLNDLVDSDQALLGHLLLVARDMAKGQGFADAGYRLVMNCNQEGGQVIFHIHLLGGRQMADTLG